MDETLAILGAVGIPLEELTNRRQEKMAKAFLSLAGMKPGSKWTEARHDHLLRSRDVIRWMNSFLGEDISSGSYDDIRRKDLLLPIQAGLVVKTAGNEEAATNDGTRAYGISKETCKLLQSFGSPNWAESIEDFLKGRERLAEILRRSRAQLMVPVTVGNRELLFGPGEHNLLQKAIIEQFLPRFGFASEVLYVGDTEDKLLFVEEERLKSIGFFELSHDKLPDVVALSVSKNWLFLIEAVHSANPISEIRKLDLDKLTAECKAGLIYVSAFLTRAAFRKFAKDIAWETEVWIAESPDHLVHFNGDKFLGPHVQTKKEDVA